MKCKYCKRKISPNVIRCEGCNYAWQDGFTDGKESSKFTINEIINLIKKLLVKE